MKKPKAAPVPPKAPEGVQDVSGWCVGRID